MEIFFISAISLLVAVVLAQREKIKILESRLEIYEWAIRDGQSDDGAD
jgi:hypothetical protein